MEEKKADIEKAFGTVSFVTLEDETSEFAFVTETLPEKAYDEKIANVNGVLGMIRM